MNQLLLDIWEGNPELDVPLLLENDIAGLIVRLNSMAGGHHMDERFTHNWQVAKQFPVQTLYFVYNPWVSGAANYDWLMYHLPVDIGARRIMVDIEVKYPDYSAVTYARQVDQFTGLLQTYHEQAIYTGQWFLPIVAGWPTTIDYWWAAYPDRLMACRDWVCFRAALDIVSFEAFTKASPGPAKLWQCAGDLPGMPGCGKHAIDVNAFRGTREELAAWLGCKPSAPVVTPPLIPDEGIYMMATRFVYTRAAPTTASTPLGNFVHGEIVGPITGIGGGKTGAWAHLADGRWVCAADTVGNVYLVEI